MILNESELYPYTVTDLASKDALIVAPHPDDAELGMGGAILKFKAEGRRVGILDLTDGEPTPQLAAIRRLRIEDPALAAWDGIELMAADVARARLAFGDDHPGIDIVEGDIRKPGDVSHAMAGASIVLSELLALSAGFSLSFASFERTKTKRAGEQLALVGGHFARS